MTTMRSFSLSLASMLRIPNLGHTDADAISVPPDGQRGREEERGGEGGENESRNSSRGGPKVRNESAGCDARVCTRVARIPGVELSDFVLPE